MNTYEFDDDDGAVSQSKWGLHVCFLDRHCVKYAGRCWRVHVFTPAGTLIVALRWQDRTQLWLPWKTYDPDMGKALNYTRWWSPIVWHPRDRVAS